ncbi:uncharacterized protein M421DRAFT_408 [Didymella exigua CBS 183.55]|uniref:AA1-like domain-containing protein n=1 Tax=Didymella exigua CBS 183.55 TaxID=1150837 RepID=A0A6A5S9X2_9PLEO|nr:uncharacterized protein M421DRAFT_408 [Didymella exigua CBS 183.55]KAF1934267.1 hypothetical protein M421DRAFT_408 [Didymella exigua CBS 183.55]
MQFFTVASLFAAAAIAAPAPQSTGCPNPAHCGGAPDPSKTENINISDFFLRRNPSIQSAGFKLSGNNATDISCEIGAVPSLPSAVTNCGTSAYSFGLTKGESTEYALAIYHETGPSAGKWAIVDFSTDCRAGPNGVNDSVCSQVNPTTIVISS